MRKGVNSSKVIGDFSTKIAYIVELVLKIKSQSKDKEKILIFSQWATILNHIASALSQNGVEYRSKFTTRDIDEFKVCILWVIYKANHFLYIYIYFFYYPKGSGT